MDNMNPGQRPVGHRFGGKIAGLRGRGQRGIHQVVVGAVPGDAIFDEARMIRAALKQWGYTSLIYAQSIHPSLSPEEVRHYTQYRPGRHSDDLLIFHYSTGSAISDYVKTLPVAVMMIYHNVTPPQFFEGTAGAVIEELKKGRAELADFRDQVCLAVADSEFNRQDLVEAGYKRTGVLPLAIHMDRMSTPADADILQKYDDEWMNLLFVGRIAPNKKQADIIEAFSYYKQINPRSRLFLVGSWGHAERYAAWLKGVCKYLDLADVYMLGHIPDTELMAYYRLADIFLCLSEHEGFGVPLIECMYLRVPIIAYPATAVPGTLGDAGVLVRRKDPRVIAELVHLLAENTDLRRRIIERQQQRAQDFCPKQVLALLQRYLATILEETLPA